MKSSEYLDEDEIYGILKGEERAAEVVVGREHGNEESTNVDAGDEVKEIGDKGVGIRCVDVNLVLMVDKVAPEREMKRSISGCVGLGVWGSSERDEERKKNEFSCVLVVHMSHVHNSVKLNGLLTLAT